MRSQTARYDKINDSDRSGNLTALPPVTVTLPEYHLCNNYVPLRCQVATNTLNCI